MTASGSRIFIANDYTKNEGNTVNHNVYHKEAGKDGIWNWKNREYDSFTAYQKERQTIRILFMRTRCTVTNRLMTLH